MTPTAYAATVVRRWRWLLLGGLAGALLALAVAPSPAYEAGAELYVDTARIADREDPAYAALVRREVLPSLVALAASPTEDLSAAGATVRAEPVEGTAVVRVVVSAGTPRVAAAQAGAVVEALREHAATSYRDADGRPLLTVATLADVAVPGGPASPGRAVLAVLGLAAGAAAAAVAAGLAEAAGPRVHTAGDVAGAPVLAELPGARRRHAPGRAEQVERLRRLLDARGWHRVLLAGPADRRARLARELPAPGGVAVLDGWGAPRPAAGPPALVVVAAVGTTSQRGVRAELARARAAGIPVAGVVLDGTGRGGRPAALLAGAERPPVGPATARWWSSPGALVALAALVAIGLDVRLPLATSSGLLVAGLLLPVWAPVLHRYRGTALLVALTAAGLLSGLLLARSAAVDHAFAPLEAASTASLVLTGLGTVGVLLWARTVLPLRAIGVAFAGGQLVHGLLRAPLSDNAFKYELSLPLTVLVLSLVLGRRRPWVPLAALGVLGALDVVNGARSAFAFCLAAAALVVWQHRPGAGGATRWWRGAVLAGLGGASAYVLLTELLLSGLLGDDVRARTAAQVARNGSLLLSGRPEWTATWALMRERPQGFGLGTVPSAGDVEAASAGIAVVDDPTVQGYLENYLLAGRFELHSVVADLWSNLGPAGLVLGLVMGGLLVHAAAALLAARRAPALVCFLVPTALWFLAFGPLPSDLDVVALALGLTLLPRSGRHVTSGPTAPAADPAGAGPAGADPAPAGAVLQLR